MYTYKLPNANTSVRLYFCFFGRCRDLSTGIGKVMIAISDTILKVAPQNQKANRFIQ
jgi:hypothetical protein